MKYCQWSSIIAMATVQLRSCHKENGFYCFAIPCSAACQWTARVVRGVLLPQRETDFTLLLKYSYARARHLPAKTNTLGGLHPSIHLSFLILSAHGVAYSLQSPDACKKMKLQSRFQGLLTCLLSNPISVAVIKRQAALLGKQSLLGFFSWHTSRNFCD